MSIPSIDLSDPLKWNLITRATLTAGISGGLPDRSFLVDSQELVIGISIENPRPTWNYAGRLVQYLPQLPSSTATAYTALTQLGNFGLHLKSYQAIALVDALPRPYVCTIEFPKWFDRVLLEVWQLMP